MYCKADSFTKIRARIIFVDVILILQSRKKKQDSGPLADAMLQSTRFQEQKLPIEWPLLLKIGWISLKQVHMKRMLSVFPFNEHELTRKTKVTFTCQLTLGSIGFVTVFKLQCLNVNLMSNDFCRTAVLRKKYMNFCVYSLLNVWNHFKLLCFPVFCFMSVCLRVVVFNFVVYFLPSTLYRFIHLHKKAVSLARPG